MPSTQKRSIALTVPKDIPPLRMPQNWYPSGLKHLGLVHHDIDGRDDDLDRQVEFCRQRVRRVGQLYGMPGDVRRNVNRAVAAIWGRIIEKGERVRFLAVQKPERDGLFLLNLTY